MRIEENNSSKYSRIREWLSYAFANGCDRAFHYVKVGVLCLIGKVCMCGNVTITGNHGSRTIKWHIVVHFSVLIIKCYLLIVH